ncbi:alpha/beta hydrolase [uncultured Desulfosarcina sp.]|uniref:alpha/beta hydrolase n=1 Tax=uncultured Desulfosarcina sp. TaxID=218289 RepID=UPI003749C1C1
MLLGIVKVLLIVFAGASLLLYLFQGRMIFFPQPTAPATLSRHADREIRLQHAGLTLTGWFFNNGIDADHPLIVYYGGNAEDVSLNFADLNRFSARSFLFMNYRGYGQSQGRPSERALCEDALFIFDRIIESEGIDPSHVVLMGRSLGSGVAVHVAANRRVGGVVLVTPFDSLVNVARAHYPIFPVKWLLRHRFDSAALAPDIAAPALFLTASHDRIVPPSFADNLRRVWGGKTTAVRIEGTDHNTIETSPDYWEAVNAFLSADSRLEDKTEQIRP